jgi:hypothetical protein
MQRIEPATSPGYRIAWSKPGDGNCNILAAYCRL